MDFEGKLEKVLRLIIQFTRGKVNGMYVFRHLFVLLPPIFIGRNADLLLEGRGKMLRAREI